MKNIKRFFVHTADILIGVIFIGILMFYILGFAGYRPYIVVSASMEPTITVGSVCLINTHVKYSDIKENDIIAYRAPNGSMVTHRVIRRTDDGLETKGDNNNISDGITTDERNYSGKNVCSIPLLGYVFRELQKARTRILCVTAGIACLIIKCFMRDGRDKENEKRETGCDKSRRCYWRKI